MTEKTLKLISMATTVISFGIMIVNGVVGAKQMDLTVGRKVAEALAKRNG